MKNTKIQVSKISWKGIQVYNKEVVMFFVANIELWSDYKNMSHFNVMLFTLGISAYNSKAIPLR